MKQKTIGEIKAELKAAEESMLPVFIENYKEDTRSGVQAAVAQAKKRIEKLEAERVRIEVLKKYEYEYAEYTYICGIDEAGRGPLAGPVAAGAVILPKDCDILYITFASEQEIDEINILQATYEAMREAIRNLGVAPDILLNDAVTIPEVSIPQVPIIKGDAKSISIGAASIIAKVTRDRLMAEYDELMPEYGFASNKGYGSAEHIAAIKKYGASPIHRMTFIKNFI